MKDKDEKERTRKEYLLLLAAFRKLVAVVEDSAEYWIIVEEIVRLRSSFLIERVLEGLKIDLDRALDVLKGHNEFITELERQERDVLVSAVENLIEFAAAAEFQVLRELPAKLEPEEIMEYEPLFSKHNLQYAVQENADVLYAAVVAAEWLRWPDHALLTYMTQGDERVRPWHLSLEGTTYRKKDFPAEFIPPIEYGCRCYLAETGHSERVADVPDTENSMKVNPVFRESLARGGRIFSEDHPYFTQELPIRMQRMVEELKLKFYRG